MFLRVMLNRFIIYSLHRSRLKNYVKVIIVVTIGPINPIIANNGILFLLSICLL
jgi:hypothetical protein